MIASVVAAGTRVNGRLRQPGNVMQESMVGFLGDRVALGDAEFAIGDDLRLSAQFVTDPANAYRLDGLDPIDRSEDTLDLVNSRRVFTSRARRSLARCWETAAGWAPTCSASRFTECSPCSNT